MKAGDLVTLSAYANGLDSLYRWSTRAREYNKQQPIVGLVIKASAPRWGNQWSYEVRWMEPDGPKGRDGQWGNTHFNRKDLKFVSRG
jgi:hypothetical protein|tara:strand:+ start:323 stop:583 length:261 start_codon:yes stop_codon:yes gene_type:complete